MRSFVLASSTQNYIHEIYPCSMKVFIFPHYYVVLCCHSLSILLSSFSLFPNFGFNSIPQYPFCEHMHAYFLSKHLGVKFLGHRV